MPLDIKISNEFIQFQRGYSPLAKQMIDLFSEGCKLRDSVQGSITDRIKAVTKWFRSDGAVRLSKIIENYLGVKIDKIHLSKSCDFGYAVQIKIGDPLGLNAAMILDRISGRPASAYYEQLIEEYKLYKPTYEELVKISESFNEKTGKFHDVKLANGSNVTAGLYFDPYSAFLMKETCHSKMEYLLPEEIAAIMIHECGHVVSCLLKAVDLWFVSNVRNKVLSEFISKAPINEKMKLVGFIAKNDGSGLAAKVLKLTSSLMRATGTDSSGKSVLPVVWMILICFLNYFFFSLAFELAYKTVCILLSHPIIYHSEKVSDFYSYNNSKNIKYSEQLADSYAVRHGLGSYLNSGLSKAESVPYFSNYDSRNSSLVWYASKVFIVALTLLNGDTSQYDEHEKLTIRQRTISRDTLNALKQMDLSDDLKRFYIEDYERQLEWIAKVPKQTKITDKLHKMHYFLEYILGIPLATFIGGRFNFEYDKLFNEVEYIISNDLGYRAAKLELLAKE